MSGPERKRPVARRRGRAVDLAVVRHHTRDFGDPLTAIALLQEAMAIDIQT